MDPTSHEVLKQEIHSRIQDDYRLLQELRAEVKPLRTQVRRIQPRETTSISLVGTDGGNNRVQFDSFLIQLVRVVDSSNNEYCLEAVTPSTSVRNLVPSNLIPLAGHRLPLASSWTHWALETT